MVRRHCAAGLAGRGMLLAAMLAALVAAADDCRAGPYSAAAAYTGTLNGEALDASMMGSFDILQGMLFASFAERPQVLENPLLAAVIVMTLTPTLIAPGGVPFDQTILGLTGGNYRASRTYSFDGFPGMQFTSLASVAMVDPALSGAVAIDGDMPADMGLVILSHSTLLMPNGPGSILETGIIELNSGLVIRWTGEHSYAGPALAAPYTVQVPFLLAGYQDDTFGMSYYSIVPEPATAGLLALGLAAVIRRRRRA